LNGSLAGGPFFFYAKKGNNKLLRSIDPSDRFSGIGPAALSVFLFLHCPKQRGGAYA
jgi:hypothetical protein